MNTPSSLRETIRLNIPASLKCLNVLSECLAAILAHVPDSQNMDITTYNIQLALHEICINIMKHAYDEHAYDEQHASDRIEVVMVLDLQTNGVEIDLFDDGTPFDKQQDVEPDLVNGQIHGYGLFLAKNLMDSVSYERLDQKNHWCLTKKLGLS